MAVLKSIAFPFRTGATSFPVPVVDEAAIEASVIQIVMTGKGERVMRPGFGCDAFAMLFESQGQDLYNHAQREIRSALMKWEPRISVNSVVVETAQAQSQDTDGQVLITINYTIVASGNAKSTTVGG